MNPELLKNKPSEEKWLSMSEASQHTPYSSEYLSLLARKGKLTAKKIDNTWYTTLSVLEDYMKRQMLRAQVQNGNFNSLSQQITTQKNFTEAGPLEDQIRPVRSYHEDIQEYLKEFKDPVAEKEAQKLTTPPRIAGQSFSSNFFEEIKNSLNGGFGFLRNFLKKEKKASVDLDSNKPSSSLTVSAAIDTSAVEQALERVLDKKLSAVNSPLLPKKHFKSFRTVFSNKILIALAIICILLSTLFPVPVVFGMFEKSFDFVKKSLSDANTVLGFRPGTHANEILLLDKNGNVSIMGHIETEGQLRSYIADGTAPIVVDSKTIVGNLNAEYLGGASSTDFTLAFVTKNGSVTTEDVKLEGNVEVGKTLLIKGATKLLSNLQVNGNLSVFGEAEFNKTLKVLGPAYFESIVNMKGDVLAGGNLSVRKNANIRGGLEVGSGIIAKGGSFTTLGVGGDLSASNIFGTNLSVTNATSTNFFAQAIGTVLNPINTIISNDISVGALTATNSILTNSTSTNATSTNLFSTNSVFTNLTVTNQSLGSAIITNSTTTNSTTTNAYITSLVAGSATSTDFFSTNLFGTTANLTNLFLNGSSTLQNFTFVNATGTQATTTNFFSSSIFGTLANLTNLIFGNATGTAATTTDLYVSHTASTTNLFANSGTIGSLNVNSAIFSNLLLNSSTTLQNFSFVNATGTQATTTNLFSTTGTFTNLFGTTLNLTNLLVTGSSTLQAFTFTNATGTQATTTNFFSTNLFSTNSNIGTTSLTNLTVTNKNTSTFAGGVNIAKSLSVGTDITDTLAVTARISTNLVPDSNISKDIGSPALYWNNGYFNTMNVNTISAASTTISGTQSNDFTINTDNATSDTENMNLIFFRGLVTPNAVIAWDSLLDKFNFNQPTLIQNQSSTTTVPTLDVRIQTGQTADIFRVTDTTRSPLFNVTTGGNVGIGTTSPAQGYAALASGSLLDVNGTGGYGTIFWGAPGNGRGTLYSSSGNVQIGSVNNVDLGFFTNNGDRQMILKTSGNVGIGTTSPLTKLSIQGSDATSANSALNVTDSNGTSKFFVRNDGNVGIGTQNPGYKLHIFGTSETFNITGTNSTGQIYGLIQNSDATGGLYYGVESSTGGALFIGGLAKASALGTGNSTALQFATNNTVAMTILSGGNVGIGTASPNYKLEVNGTASTTALFATSATTTNLFSSIASSTNLFSSIANIGSLTASALTAGPITSGAITSGLINGQTISSAANFTGTLTATGGLSTLSNLLLNGSTTLQNFTFVNATGTQATTTNHFSTNLWSTFANLGSATTTSLFGTNVFGTNGNFGTLTAVSATTTDLYVSHTASTTNLFANSGTIGSLTGNSATLTNLLLNSSTTLQNFTFTNATGTSATTTNLFSTNLQASRIISPFTQGSVIFAGAGGVLSQNNTNFNWNDSGNLLTATNASTTNLWSGGNTWLAVNGGNVGIGTTGPVSKLDVNNGAATYTLNTAATAVFSRAADAAVSGGYLFGDGSAGSDVVPILSVAENAAANNIATGIGFGIKGNGNTVYTIAGIAGVKTNAIDGAGGDVGALTFGTRATGDYVKERMRIDSAGNVGIGTTGPNYLVDMQTTGTTLTHNIKVNAAAAANNYGEIAFQTWSGAGSGLNTFGGAGTSRPSVVLRGLSEDNAAKGAFVVATFSGGADNTNLTEKFRITSGGNVGIGTTNPNYKLEVNGTASTTNFYASYATTTNFFSSSIFGTLANLTNLIFGNATGTQATTTNLFSTTGTFGNLFSTTATSTNLFSTNSNLGVVTSGLINGQTISSAANFTGTATVATNVSVTGANGVRSFLMHNGGIFSLYNSADTETWRLQTTNTNDFLFNPLTSGAVQFGTSPINGITTITTSGAINGQTISSAANFTGTMAIATSATTPIIYGGTAVGSTLTLNGTSNGAPSSAYVLLNPTNGQNVGIGTTNPGEKLDVVAANMAINSGDSSVFIRSSDAFAIDKGGSLGLLGKFDTAGDYTQFATIAGRKENVTDGDSKGYLQFGTRNGVNQVEAMRITSGGNVGIGTTNPQTGLHVKGAYPIGFATIERTSVNGVGLASIMNLKTDAKTVNDGTMLTFQGLDSADNAQTYGSINTVIDSPTSGSEKSSLYLSSYNAGTANNGLVINYLGNVGIGTTNPLAALQIKQAANKEIQLGTTAGELTIATYFPDLATLGAVINLARPSDGHFVNGIFSYDTAAGANNNLGIVARSDMEFSTGVLTSPPMVIKASGNVGIGTTTPGEKFQVYGGNIFVDRPDNTSRDSIYFGTGATYDWGIGSLTGNSDLTFRKEGVGSYMTILNSTGNVGIGTVGPGDDLTIQKTTAGYVTSRVRNDDTGSGSYAMSVVNAYGNSWGMRVGSAAANSNRLDFVEDASAPNPRLSILVGGNVGIGTTNPNYKLEVNGTASTTNLFATNATTTNLFSTTASSTNLFSTNSNLGVVTSGLINGQTISSAANFTGTMAIATSATTPIVYGGTAAGSTLTLNGTSNGSPSSAYVLLNPTNGQNVGIGTTGPGSRLDILNNKASDVVAGATAVTLNLQESVAGVGSAIRFGGLAGSGGGGNMGMIRWNAGASGSAPDNYMILSAEAQDVLQPGIVLLGSGNVGIGTTTPTGLLEVGNSTTGVILANITNSGGGTGDYTELNIRNDYGAESGLRLATLGTAFTTSGAFTQDAGLIDADLNLSGGLNLAARHASGVMRFYTGGSAAGNERMRIDATGNVGIGTTNPLYALHVVTTTNGEAIAGINNKTTGTNYGVDGEATGAGATTNIGGYFTAAGGTNNYGLQIGGPVASANNYALYSSSPAQSYIAGNVGIGTTAPLAGNKLEVNGRVSASDFYATGAGAIINTTSAGTGSQYLYTQNAAGQIYFGVDSSTGASFGTANAGFVWLTNNAPLLFATNNTEKMRILANGNVGIGTTGPSGKLHIYNSDTGSTITQDLTVEHAGTGAGGSGTMISLKAAGVELSRIETANDTSGGGSLRFYTKPTGAITERMRIMGDTGNVGIGTTGPGAGLDIQATQGAFSGTIGGSQVSNLTILNPASTAGSGSNILFAGYYRGDTASYPAGSIGMVRVLGNDSSADTPATNMVFRTSLDVSNYNVERMRITAAGNVGIGTTNPTVRLTVKPATSNQYPAVFLSNDFVQDTTGSDLLFKFGATSGNTFSEISAYNTGGTVATNLVLNSSGGNVGIGTTTPGAKLNVLGTAATTPTLLVQNDALTSGVLARFYSNNGSPSHSGNMVEIDNDFNAGGTADLLYLNQADDGRGIVLNMQRAGTGITVDGVGGGYSAIFNNGNVGIGTTNPGAFLHVNKAVGTTLGSNLSLALTDNNGTINTLYQMGLGYQAVSTDFTPAVIGYLETSNTAYTHGDIIFAIRAGTTNVAPTEAMRITSTGNVGIGTTGPSGKLDVELTDTSSDRAIMAAISGAKTVTSYGQVISNSATNATTDGINKIGLYVDSTGTFTGGGGTATNNYGLYVTTVSGADNNYGAYIAGNVGIGTTAPAVELETYKSTESGISIAGNRTVDNTVGTLGFRNYAIAGADKRLGMISVNRYGADNSGKMDFTIYNAGAQVSAMTILNSGNVGIGITNPVHKLDLYTATGNIFNWMESGDNSRAQYIAKNSVNSAYFGMESTAGTTFTNTLADAALFGSSGAYASQIISNGAVAMTVLSSGNVGIGTVSPNFKLEVQGTASTTNLFSTNSNIGVVTSGLINGQTISSVASFTGTVSAATGFKINGGAATSGNYLRGDGTNFVANTIQAGDVPTLNQSTSGTAAIATATTITDDTTTAATMYPTWVTTASGNQSQKVSSTKFTFVPSTGVLSATSFTGAGTGLTGTASSLTAGTVTTNANLTGDVTSSGNTTTLATVNANVGSFGSSTSIPSFTVNGKGLITAASGNVVIAPAGTLSGTTLNSTVVSSSLTSIGTLSSGAVPASLITAGTFGTGNYSFGTGTLTVGAITSSGALALGSNTITSGLINGQTISSAANFTGSLTMAGSFANTSTSNSYFTGNLGIGTTSPLTKLSIQGTAGANDVLNVASSTGASMLYVNSAGNVGIGTTTPWKTFSVNGVAYASGGVQVGDLTASAPACDATTLGLAVVGTARGSGSLGTFYVCTKGILGTYFWVALNGTGNNPDLAEYVPVQDESIQGGELISVSNVPNPNGSAPYDRFFVERTTAQTAGRVLGVVSTNPGQILNTPAGGPSDPLNTTGLKPLALAGRVPVRVTTENGLIHTGDYVTASKTIPGRGMKATETGDVVGQALDDYDENTGEVLVLVNNMYRNFAEGLSLNPETIRMDDFDLKLSNFDSKLSALENSFASTTARLDSLDFQLSTLDSKLLTFDSRLSTLDFQLSTLMASSSALTLTASTTENIISSTLTAMGASIVDGITHFKQLAVESLSAFALTVGTKDKPTGITLYDQITGAPFCMKIVNGQPVTTAGDCNSPPFSQPATLTVSSTSSTTPTTTTDTTASTTPATIDTSASTTPTVDTTTTASTTPVVDTTIITTTTASTTTSTI